MMRIIAERTLEKDEELCVCFIDWQKAFDRVNWTKLMQIRTRTLSKRAATDPRLRPLGHWDRHMKVHLQQLTEYTVIVSTNCHQIFVANLKNSLTKICSSQPSSLQLHARLQPQNNNLAASQQLNARCHVNKMVTSSLNSLHYHINIGLCIKCMVCRVAQSV